MIGVINIFLSPAFMYAGQSFFTTIKNFIVPQEYYSRFKLYGTIIDKENIVPLDEKFIEHLQGNDEHYLDMIEESILKREHNGPKADKSFSASKISYGLVQSLFPAFGYAGITYFNVQCPEQLKIPAIGFSSLVVYFGLKNIYKGFCYKSRMETKLARDKAVRRFLREITGQI